MTSTEQIKLLKEFVTETRWERFNEVLSHRTRYATVVLEDIYQSHNASAVVRSCELLGVQDIHIIENSNSYKVNPEVSVGASAWLNFHKYNQEENNTLSALQALKKQGYRIVATTPHTNDTTLEDFDISKGKFALVFGSEMPGISDIVRDNADEFLRINTFGFTESFNISVSVAVTLHTLTNKIRNSLINWTLSEQEKDQILLDWLKYSVKSADEIIKRHSELI